MCYNPRRALLKQKFLKNTYRQTSCVKTRMSQKLKIKIEITLHKFINYNKILLYSVLHCDSYEI